MAAPFVHLEVLGPRAALDAWLAVIQDHGGCHLADALAGLEGEAGIARPRAGEREQQGALLRSEAALVLRGIERYLPASAAGEDAGRRPPFQVGPAGQDEVELEKLVEEARTVGGRIAVALEAARAAEHEVDAGEGESRVLDAFAALGAEGTYGRAWRLSRLRARGFGRALRRAGWKTASLAAGREAVVVAAGEGGEEAVGDAAASARADAVVLPDDLRGRAMGEARAALADRLGPARFRLEQALAALRRRIEEDGGRARLLLDALEDAEARQAAWRALAATEHVVAARAFVRPEDVEGLRLRLDRAFGREVVVRELDPGAPDMPALPRRVAGLPFAALEGLRPARFGEVATASLLALFVPPVVGAVLADLGAGLVLLLVGALVGAGSALGTPRRDTALLAQVAGLVSLVFGILGGRAFGALGDGLFGADWGLAAGVGLFAPPDPLRALALWLGGTALLIALWGGLSAALAAGRGTPGRARSAAVGALAFLAIAGGSALALPGDSWLRLAWVLAPAAAVGILLLAGPRGGLGRLLLDVVGVVRLVAVALLAILLFTVGFAMLARPTVMRVVMGPALLLLGALATVVDPAHVAMGVPYDLSLGARALGRPFRPLARHVVRGRPWARTRPKTRKTP